MLISCLTLNLWVIHVQTLKYHKITILIEEDGRELSVVFKLGIRGLD